jgi:hypothetical protein
METASDDWFVDFDGDGLPDLSVGRAYHAQCLDAAASSRN